jgi:hypothetical protein
MRSLFACWSRSYDRFQIYVAVHYDNTMLHNLARTIFGCSAYLTLPLSKYGPLRRRQQDEFLRWDALASNILIGTHS